MTAPTPSRDAARVSALEQFRADQGRFPGALATLRRLRLAETQTDDSTPRGRRAARAKRK